MKKNKFQQAINTISFNENNESYGEYGVHGGFFSLLVTVDGTLFDVQGCAENDVFNPANCGHNDGICGDVNKKLALKLSEDFYCDISRGYFIIKLILTEAYMQYFLKYGG